MSNKLENRYNKYDNIITHVFKKKKYDNEHNITVIFSILGIKISTIEVKDILYITIYRDSKCLSFLSLQQNKPVNTKIKLILQLEYLDDLNIKNIIAVYNSGNIIHKNSYTAHIYNYKGERRKFTNQY